MKTPIKSLLTAAIVASLGFTASAQVALPGGINLLTTPHPTAAQFDADIALLNGGVSLNLNESGNAQMKFMGPWTVSAVPNSFGVNGGTVKVFYIGKTAGWENDLGYVLNPPPGGLADYKPIVTDIGSALTTPPFGNSTTIAYGAGWNPIDFFINAVPTAGDPDSGGVYYAFGTPNEPPTEGIHVIWKDFLINGITTTVVGFEDKRLGISDLDRNDLVVAFQVFQNEPVPEPATYGLMGAISLLALVGYRRFKAKQNKQAAVA